MASDLVDRLRALSNRPTDFFASSTSGEAADRIEALERVVRKTERALRIHVFVPIDGGGTPRKRDTCQMCGDNIRSDSHNRADDGWPKEVITAAAVEARAALSGTPAPDALVVTGWVNLWKPVPAPCAQSWMTEIFPTKASAVEWATSTDRQAYERDLYLTTVPVCAGLRGESGNG